MRKSIWYYYLPNGLKQYAILYLAAGIFVPIGIAKLEELIKTAAKILMENRKQKSKVR